MLQSDFDVYDRAMLHRAASVLIHEREHGQLQWMSTKRQQFSIGPAQRFINIWEGVDGMMTNITREFPMPPCISQVSHPFSSVGLVDSSSSLGVPQTFGGTFSSGRSNIASYGNHQDFYENAGSSGKIPLVKDNYYKNAGNSSTVPYVIEDDYYENAGNSSTVPYVIEDDYYENAGNSSTVPYVIEDDYYENAGNSSTVPYINDEDLYGNGGISNNISYVDNEDLYVNAGSTSYAANSKSFQTGAENEETEYSLTVNAGSNSNVSRNVTVGEKKFWGEMFKLYDSLNGIGQELNTLQKGFNRNKKGIKAKKRRFRKLADLYYKLKKIHEQIDDGKDQMQENGYRNIFLIMSRNDRLKFRQEMKLQCKPPQRIDCILGRWKEMAFKVKDILIKQAQHTEPYRNNILQVAITELVDNNEGLQGFHDSAQKSNEGDSKGNSGQKTGKSKIFAAGVGQETGKCKIFAAGVSPEVFTEGMFWKSLQELKKHIVKATTSINNIDSFLARATKKMFRQRRISCRELVRFHARINFLSSHFSFLREVMAIKHFPERELTALGDLQGDETPQFSHIRPGLSSLQVVEAMLNNLKSVFMRTRDDRMILLRRAGCINNPQDLTFVADNVIKL